MKMKERRKLLFIKIKHCIVPSFKKGQFYTIEDPIEYIYSGINTEDYHIPPKFGFEKNTILNNILPYATLESLEKTSNLLCKHRIQKCLNRQIFKKHYIFLGCSGYYFPSEFFFLNKNTYSVLAISNHHLQVSPFEMFLKRKKSKIIANKKRKQRIYQSIIKIAHLDNIEHMLKEYAKTAEKMLLWQEKINMNISRVEKEHLEKSLSTIKNGKKLKI